MNILFYTDPHFSLARRENVTETSLRAREAFCLGYLDELTSRYTSVVCLGDLFDRANNKEEAILKANEAIEHTTYVLAGNHDIINREGAVSSLHLLSEIAPEKIILDPIAIPLCCGVTLHFIPHHRTQSEFDTALETAYESCSPTGKHFLLLHCNYDSPYADKEQDLNLSGGMAEKLLTKFDTILIGHEHAARDLLGGRVRIIGSLFPTSFGDVEAKHRALVYNTNTEKFDEIVTNCVHYTGSASEYAGDPSRGYITLINDLPAGEASKLAVKLFENGAFAVKILSNEEVKKAEVTPEIKRRNLPDIVRDTLTEQDAQLLALWDEFLSSFNDR